MFARRGSAARGPSALTLDRRQSEPKAPYGQTASEPFQTASQGFWPARVVVDQAGGADHCRAKIDQVGGGRTQVIALVPDYGKRTDRFVPADFTLSADGISLTCRNEVTTK